MNKIKEKACTVEGCDRKYKAKGFCMKHYHCYKRFGDPNVTKMERHGMEGTPIYNSWANMKGRCLNPNNPDYKHYGGRGIKICDRWLDFKKFYADMGEKPEGLEIDRIDNNGSYEPGNCRWTNHKENMRNTRRTVLSPMVVERIRKMKSIGLMFREIAERTGFKDGTIQGVFYGKWA